MRPAKISGIVPASITVKVELASMDMFIGDPAQFWEFHRPRFDMVASVDPNPAHDAVAELERRGVVKAVITQNIDGLHRSAGSAEVIEVHGSLGSGRCLRCDFRPSVDELLARADGAEDGVPRCDCGFQLKSDVVLFGEQIPIDALIGARDEANNCDLMMVIGTSSMVFPASELPILAKSKKAIIVEINPEPTHLTGFVSDYFIDMESDKAVPRIVQEVEALVSDKG